MMSAKIKDSYDVQKNLSCGLILWWKLSSVRAACMLLHCEMLRVWFCDCVLHGGLLLKMSSWTTGLCKSWLIMPLWCVMAQCPCVWHIAYAWCQCCPGINLLKVQHVNSSVGLLLRGQTSRESMQLALSVCMAVWPASVWLSMLPNMLLWSSYALSGAGTGRNAWAQGHGVTTAGSIIIIIIK